MGYVVIALNELTTNQGFKNFVLPHGLESEFIYYYLRHIKPIAEAMATGTTFKELSGAKAAQLPLLIAPLNEQKRIADKLDTLLSRVDACQIHLDRVPQILERFRQSVLDFATSGRLTEEWRKANPQQETGDQVIQKDASRKQDLLLKDETLAKKKSTVFSDIDSEYLFDIPDAWAFTTWGRISEWITYGFTRPMPSSDNGVKLITAKDVLNFSLLLDGAGFTTEEAFKELSDKDRPLRGDLLITKDGTIGRATLVQTDEAFCINQSVSVCWLRSTQMSKRFLEIVVNADFTQRFVKDKAQGMAIQHLSVTDFAQCPVPVPPLAEQHEIACRVETLFELAEQIEARWKAARERVAQLTPSLLVKAFHGELVVQDPNDEPASALLERIKRARENAPEAPKKPRRRTEMTAEKTEKVDAPPGVVQALKTSGKELSAQQLFQLAGYPQDAESERVEMFFVEVRDALKSKQVDKKRLNDVDWFSLLP